MTDTYANYKENLTVPFIVRCPEKDSKKSMCIILIMIVSRGSKFSVDGNIPRVGLDRPQTGDFPVQGTAINIRLINIVCTKNIAVNYSLETRSVQTSKGYLTPGHNYHLKS